MTTKASVIVPCYLLPDGGSLYHEDELLLLTQACVESLRNHCPGVELVIVDNGSLSGRDYLRSVADVYIRFQENRGFAPAVNAGLRVAQGEHLVVCNNDIEFLDDWVGQAMKTWDHWTGVISSHLHDHDPRHKVGRLIAPWGHFFGALWMVSQEVLSKVGELDEGYERGMFEDRDFVRRVIGAGYQHVKVGWCKHVGNATWGKLPNQHEIYLRNKERFEAKWVGDS